MKIFLTGCAGFIGAATSEKLLLSGHHVIGVDDLNSYYDVRLKRARLKRLQMNPNFQFVRLNIIDRILLQETMNECGPEIIVHLAAQPGVRHSLVDPYIYTDSNVTGLLNVIEGARHLRVKHFVFASSSSVYGAQTKIPYSEHDCTDHPVSLYAATKKAGEMICHSYCCLFQIPVTVLRFFTVYGPWGRPDMAVFSFTEKILNEQPIPIFNFGRHQRDFTYIDDVVESIQRIVVSPPAPNNTWNPMSPDPALSPGPYRILNIGNHHPVALTEFVRLLEEVIGKKAICEFKQMSAGDVEKTFADVTRLEKHFHFAPKTDLRQGLEEFYRWYCSFYQTSGNSLSL